VILYMLRLIIPASTEYGLQLCFDLQIALLLLEFHLAVLALFHITGREERDTKRLYILRRI
jgi:hypothetical protein